MPAELRGIANALIVHLKVIVCSRVDIGCLKHALAYAAPKVHFLMLKQGVPNVLIVREGYMFLFSVQW